jgi:hypothetical protein
MANFKKGLMGNWKLCGGCKDGAKNENGGLNSGADLQAEGLDGRLREAFLWDAAVGMPDPFHAFEGG